MSAALLASICPPETRSPAPMPPGLSASSMKTSSVIPISVGIISSSLRAMYASMVRDGAGSG